MEFSPIPGTEVAGYRIVSEIGRGGSATVYLAQHPGLRRQVALKILAPALAEEPSFRERFSQEARVAAALEHPNALPVYDAGTFEGLLWIAMRYVDGTDLSALLRSEGPLEPERALPMLAQIAAALDAAHAKGLVHRDVKPANVLIDQGAGPRGADHLYLADFGLAKVSLGISELTQAGELYGTVDYMAPEQLVAGPVDARTDVYALACLAFEVLVGNPPLHRDTLVETAAAHLHAEAPVPSAQRAGLGSQVDIAIARGLSKDKASRPPRASLLVELLRGDRGEDRTVEVGARSEDLAMSRSEEERKVVTTLFCELVGVTTDSDADPEDVRSRIRPYRQLLRTEIMRFGGTVNRFVGDTIMAVFGAPVSHEDDAERAVRAGLRIVAGIAELSAAHSGAGPNVRVGIETGEAIVLLGAGPEDGDSSVTGDVVNNASHLLGAAPIGAVVVGKGTFVVTKGTFDYEELAPAQIQGRAQPIATFRATAARSRTRGHVQLDQETRFVAREEEIAILAGSLRRATRQSSCQLVTIVGEPGIGKSRLLAEFSRNVDDLAELVSWRQGGCLPYGDGVTFWALGEVVKAHAGILESDGPKVAGEKLLRVLRPILDGNDLGWVEERLKPLIGLATAGSDVRQEELFGAWRTFLEGVASTRPLVVVLEDLHWADAPLLAFIEHLAEYSTSVPMLIACTARPELFERHPGWGGGQRNATTISLAPLSDAETSVLISSLLENVPLPPEVDSTVLERAGGNPLYAEEFIRMLRDRGILTRVEQRWTLAVGTDVPLPESIQALIAARIDTLPRERKELIHDAAVIGRVFWSGAVAAIGDRQVGEVTGGLHELARKELVRASRSSTVEGEAEYGFWHGLVRDVAYAQIPKSARAGKHLAAGEWIEHMAGDRVADHAEVLAHHYAEALQLRGGDTGALRAKAATFFEMAADRALAVNAGKAVALYEQALALRAEGDAARLTLRLAEALEIEGHFTRAEEILRRMLDEPAAEGDPFLRASALRRLSHVVAYTEGAPQSRRLLQAAIELMEEHPPTKELAWSYARMAGQYALESLPGALELAERAFALAEQLGLESEMVASLISRSLAKLISRGDPAGIADGREALRLAQRFGLGREVALAYNNLAIALWPVEGPRAAMELCAAGIEFSRKRGFEEIGLGLRATRHSFLFDLGRWSDSLEALREDLAEAREREDRWVTVELDAYRTRILAIRGETDSVDERSLETARSSGFTDMLLLNLAVRGLEAAQRNDRKQARAFLAEFADVWEAAPLPLGVQLAEVIRVAVWLGDELYVERVVRATPTSMRRHDLTREAAEVMLAELRGDLRSALEGYRRSVDGFRTYGSVVEHAHALFGVYRCAANLGLRDDAASALERALSIVKPLRAPGFAALLGPTTLA